jgi:hypothetical protein
VVVESVFGNTREIADAVATGLSSGLEVETVDVAGAPVYFQSVDLMVVGGPTHAFGLTSPSSRRSAAEQSDGAVTVPETGLREWLESLPPGGGLAVATFDTRVDHPRLPGSAAAKAARRLTRRDYRTVADSQSFRVVGTRGPLVAGERARAEAWGAELAARFAPAAPGGVAPSEGTSSP